MLRPQEFVHDFTVQPPVAEDGSAEVRFDAYVCGDADEISVLVNGDSGSQSVTLYIPVYDTQTIYDEDALCGIRLFTGTLIIDYPHLWN